MNKDKYHHGDLRNTLIKKGIEFINDNGIDNISLRKVASMCGVSHNAPYSHFKDKEDFIESIKKFVEEEFATVLLDTINENKNNPEITIQLGKAYVLFFIENPQYFYFLLNQRDLNIYITNEEIKASNYSAFEIFKATSMEWLSSLGIPKEDQTERILAMWSMVQGITALTIMKGVTYDGDWGELVENILRNRISILDKGETRK